MASRSDKPHALLTACHGFTGRYVAAELEADGYEVVGLALGGDSADEDILATSMQHRYQLHRCVQFLD